MNDNIFGGIVVTFILVIVALTLFLLVTSFTGFHRITGEGTQVGYVSAVEKEGVFFKTGRAYIKPTLESTQEDIYCVVDDAVYNDLQEASRYKTRIEVQHFSWFANGVKNCGGENAVIKSFDVI